MKNMVFFLIELAATFVEFWLGLRMNSCIMKRGEKKRLNTILATLILMGMIMLINQYQLFSIWASLVAIAGIAIASTVVYRIRIPDSLVISTAYIAILHIIDALVISLWGTMMRDSDFMTEMLKGYSVVRSLVVISCKTTMLFVGFLIMHKIAPRVNVFSRKIVGVVIAGAFLVWYFMNITIETTNAPILMIWIVLLVFTVVGVYLATEYAGWKQEKTEYELIAAHNRSSAQIYEELSKNYDQNRRLYHDLNNHYMSLQGYLKNGDYQKAVDYLEDINELNELTLTQWTGIPALDMLLNYKVSEAKKKGIRVEIISDHINLNLVDYEITALFGNALDNAIEACQQVEKELRWVKVGIRKVTGMTFAKISNPYANIRTDKAGRLLTTKADGDHHGLGTKGMEQIVEKYGGTLQYKTENGIFILEIAFF